MAWARASLIITRAYRAGESMQLQQLIVKAWYTEIIMAWARASLIKTRAYRAGESMQLKQLIV